MTSHNHSLDLEILGVPKMIEPFLVIGHRADDPSNIVLAAKAVILPSEKKNM